MAQTLILPLVPEPPVPGMTRVYEAAEGATVLSADIGAETVMFERHTPEGTRFVAVDVDVLRYVLRRVEEFTPARTLHRPVDLPAPDEALEPVSVVPGE